MIPACKPWYVNVDGLKVVGIFKPENVRAAMNYVPRPDDVMIVTYPKCGTTWTQYIVGLIFRRGKPFQGAKQFFTCSPFFEMLGQDYVDRMPRPGAFKIHLPVSHLRHWSKDARYIYVARNPKDCVVSMYYHTKMFQSYQYDRGTFDQFFELFMDGSVECNDYFDHLIGWFEKRHEPNVLFITYEDMKANPERAVMQIAEFLGSSHAKALRDDPKLLQDILHYSSFDHMKNDVNDIWGYFLEPEFSLTKLEEISQRSPKVKSTFCRKGVVGDWRGHLTLEQVERIDEKFRMKARGSDILSLWDGLS